MTFSPADMRELQRLLALEARAAAHEDCAACKHSIGCDLETAQRMRTQGYQQGRGMYLNNVGCVCELHRLIAPTPCQDYEPWVGP